MRTGLAVFAATIAAVVLGSAAPAAAQTLPQGTYRSSCTGARMVDNVLFATCLTADQTPRETTLNNPFACQIGVANANGRLVCAAATPAPSFAPPAPAQPQGMAKFTTSCPSLNFFAVRIGGAPDNVFHFRLNNGEIVHFELPRNSTYSMQCDRFPDGAASFRFIDFE